MGQFKQGQPKKGGRQKGSVNKLTKTVKESVLSVFNDLQTDPKHNLKKFAQTYPRDFYQIAAKLIPTEIKGNLTGKIQLEVVRKSAGTTNA